MVLNGTRRSVVKRVFADTSALIALLDKADVRHAAARAAFENLGEDELVTHGYVIAEALAVARRRFGVDAVVALIDDFLPVIGLLAVEPGLHGAAQAAYRASLPSAISFVDRVSFELMAREGIDLAFAIDPDFITAGFVLLPA